MKVRVITPSPDGLADGNRSTAVRWARILRDLGHDVSVGGAYDGEDCDLLVALHARKSAAALRAFRKAHPERPAVLVTTGTDVYGGLDGKAAQQALADATRIVTLQADARERLPVAAQRKAVVIRQSARPLDNPPPRVKRWFQVAVLCHLRPVKDPLRAARAARRLPEDSRIRVRHVGSALTAPLEQAARAEDEENPRYDWLGPKPRWQARRVLAASHVAVISSRSEGGSNVLSEALAGGVPVLATRIPGLVATLGEDHPGLFDVGDTDGLAALMRRAETDRAWYRRLEAACRRLAPLVRPARERRQYRELLAGL